MTVTTLLLSIALAAGAGLGGWLTGLPWGAPGPDGKTVARRRGLLLATTGVGAGFWVVLALGFRLHGQAAPPPLEAGLLPAAAMLAVSLACAVRWLWRRRGAIGIGRRPSPRRVAAGRETLPQRLAALDADPRRRPYADRLRRGDVFWTGERIDYDLDPAATACCPHLAPLEASMRRAGIDVRRVGDGSARAACRLDAPALALPIGVAFEAVVLSDRRAVDGYAARLRCAACASTLEVLHVDEAPEGTPWFPAPTVPRRDPKG
ncbi:MAG: hypothetical protein JNN18_05760 [Rubrivivax sp.]|nr:hypothetical protein [Rubrivivax sp.]